MSTSQQAVAASKLTRKGRQTRQRIVEAAADLMVDRGVAGTTMEDVRRKRCWPTSTPWLACAVAGIPRGASASAGLPGWLPDRVPGSRARRGRPAARAAVAGGFSSTEPLEAALDTVLAHISSLTVAAPAESPSGAEGWRQG